MRRLRDPSFWGAPMAALFMGYILIFGACTATATPLAEAIVAKDKIEQGDLDAFKALVENSNAPPDAKAWYVARIEQDRMAQRLLTDNALALCEAIGKVDWTATALAAWKVVKEARK